MQLANDKMSGNLSHALPGDENTNSIGVPTSLLITAVVNQPLLACAAASQSTSNIKRIGVKTTWHGTAGRTPPKTRLAFWIPTVEGSAPEGLQANSNGVMDKRAHRWCRQEIHQATCAARLQTYGLLFLRFCRLNRLSAQIRVL